MTSKGQMTLPKGVRDRFGLKAGDQLDVRVDGSQIILTPRNLELKDILSILPQPSRATVEEMNEAIGDEAAESGR